MIYSSVDHRRHPDLKNFQIFMYHIPDDLVVDAKIIVNQSIPHPRHFLPGHQWKQPCEIRWNFLCGFTNDLEAPEYSPHPDGVLNEVVIGKLRRCRSTDIDLYLNMLQELNKRWLHIPLRLRYDIR